ncbi:hypothetical protein GCM10027569_87850 [Flindersiella endophytica]
MKGVVIRLGDRLLARLVPRVQAAASTQTCLPVQCLTALCPDGTIVDCYKTCCDNPGHPPSCGSCRCPCP